MKRTGFINFVLIIMVSAMCCLSGCINNIVELSSLSLEYVEVDNYIDKEETVYESIDCYFSEPTRKGLIAKINPSKYTFIYNVYRDEDTGSIFIDGYAECTCSIVQISQRYNNSEYNEGDSITIRQSIYLEPLNDEAMSKMFKNIGAYKNNEVVLGQFKANNAYINENDYRLIVSESTIILSDKQAYFAFITIEKDIPYLSMICPQKDEALQRLPDEILLGISNFKAFLLTNDNNLFN